MIFHVHYCDVDSCVVRDISSMLNEFMLRFVQYFTRIMPVYRNAHDMGVHLARNSQLCRLNTWFVCVTFLFVFH